MIDTQDLSLAFNIDLRQNLLDFIYIITLYTHILKHTIVGEFEFEGVHLLLSTLHLYFMLHLVLYVC